MSLSLLMAAALAAEAARQGDTCIVADAWWGSASPSAPRRTAPESVKVLELRQMPTGAAGAWVQPVVGPMSAYQFQITRERLKDCRR